MGLFLFIKDSTCLYLSSRRGEKWGGNGEEQYTSKVRAECKFPKMRQLYHSYH